MVSRRACSTHTVFSLHAAYQPEAQARSVENGLPSLAILEIGRFALACASG